ncbi:glycosyl hydrolase family 65 protein [Pseudomonas massiliensis]|uniref:glycosyl hydrolase family 65 protein n=1 Tax=Pseudomonas massiliensis TaxID=522492 RepID=UPI0006933178|nr:glycosyl hydrolase family 65 protein [Pseudomonas massiliensis]
MSDIRFDCYDPADERRREALFSLSNGVISLRASAPERAVEEIPAPGYPGLYLAGFYDNAPRWVNGERCQVEALVNLPDPLGLSLSLDRQTWLGTDYRDYQQTYDLASCELRRVFTLNLGGHPLRIEECRLVSHAEPDILAVRWQVSCCSPPPGLWLRTTLRVRANSLIERNLAYEGQRLRAVTWWQSEQGHGALQASLADGESVSIATHVHTGQAPVWQGVAEQRDAWLSWPGEGPLVIEKQVRVRQGATDLARLCDGWPAVGFQALREAHRRAWQPAWSAGRMCLEQAALQQPLDFALGHILQTVTPLSLGHDLGFPARGWQEGYQGQIFWDELFVFPFLTSHFPERAINLLAYRYRRLDAARARARDAGLRGALFPWRSAASGHEQTPPWLYYPLSGHWVKDPTWRQYHIGAAIAYDAWLLYLATGDRELLAGMAGEIVLEVARCWASLARWDRVRARYVIEGVIGPDEYHNGYPGAPEAGLNNNSYTNLMAAWTLQKGLQVLGELAPEQAAGLRQRLGLTDEELAHWADVGRRLYLPELKPGVLAQFEGFEDLLMPPRAWFDDEHPRLDWMLEAQGDRVDHYQISKQADTLMLLHLFSPQAIRELVLSLGYAAPQENGREAVAYHLSRISHESSLSHTVCAGAMAHVDMGKSWRFFGQCLGTDLGAAADSGTVEGVHLAAMSGALDVLQRHYLGLRPALDGLHLFPAIPDELGPVRLCLQYRGQWLDVHWDGRALQVRLRESASAPVRLVHHWGHTWLSPGAPWQAEYPLASTPP